jgi:hypothetical protein
MYLDKASTAGSIYLNHSVSLIVVLTVSLAISWISNNPRTLILTLRVLTSVLSQVVTLFACQMWIPIIQILPYFGGINI